MPRHQNCFCEDISFKPNFLYFKPKGIKDDLLDIVEISMEEMESFRLRHVVKLEQTESAFKMHTSQSTYQRILYSAYEKIADALINGKAIKIIRHKNSI